MINKDIDKYTGLSKEYIKQEVSKKAQKKELEKRRIIEAKIQEKSESTMPPKSHGTKQAKTQQGSDSTKPTKEKRTRKIK